MSKNKTQDLVGQIVKAHSSFEGSFKKALGHAKAAGEALVRLQTVTGKKGEKLFAVVTAAGCKVKKGSLYLYIRVASHWNEIVALAGDDGLDDLTLSRALELLRTPRESKPVPKSRSNEGGGEPVPPVTEQTDGLIRLGNVVEVLGELAAEKNMGAKALTLIAQAEKHLRTLQAKTK